MPVNLSSPVLASLHPVAGLRLGIASAGIKKPGRRDLTLIELAPGSNVAGVFTQNRFCAAPVTLCRERLAGGSAIRALLINTGNANAGTGAEGLARARQSCDAVAEIMGLSAESVLPFSTGVILEPLPIDKIIAALPDAKADLAPDHWSEASHAIMTTDIVAKAASAQIKMGGKNITVTGMAKGSGMIHPNMATMLGYVATDARVSRACLNQLAKEVADISFNCVTVDGDTSTNDSFILIATGQAGHVEITEPGSADYAALKAALSKVAVTLAQAMARDGEGATKFITVQVDAGRDGTASRIALPVQTTAGERQTDATRFGASQWNPHTASISATKPKPKTPNATAGSNPTNQTGDRTTSELDRSRRSTTRLIATP